MHVVGRILAGSSIPRNADYLVASGAQESFLSLNLGSWKIHPFLQPFEFSLASYSSPLMCNKAEDGLRFL